MSHHLSEHCIAIPGQPILIDSQDRGLHYGHGLFETLSVYQGRIPFWRAHLERLCLGSQRLELGISEAALVAQIRERCAQILTRESDGILKLCITAGVGPRGYAPPSDNEPNVLLFWYPSERLSLVEPSQEAVSALLCQTQLSVQPLLAGIKHLNRLEQVLAASELKAFNQRYPACHVDEGLVGCVSDTGGELIEGVSSNLFVLDPMDSNRLLTPKLDQCGVAGVMRRYVIEWATEAGYQVQETAPISLKQLYRAGGFVTNSVKGCKPLACLYNTKGEVLYEADQAQRKTLDQWSELIWQRIQQALSCENSMHLDLVSS